MRRSGSLRFRTADPGDVSATDLIETGCDYEYGAAVGGPHRDLKVQAEAWVEAMMEAEGTDDEN